METTTKHTPGPWSVSLDGAGDPLCIDSSEGSQLAMVEQLYGNKDAHLEAEANARLIASAPELLEALKRMIELHGMTMNGQSHGAEWQLETLKLARAAIAKATGN